MIEWLKNNESIISIVANIGVVVASVFCGWATIRSIKVTRESTEVNRLMQKELTRQRFARYDTIVRSYRLGAFGSSKSSCSKQKMFDEFLIGFHADCMKNPFYRSEFVKNNSIDDLEEFVQYACKVAEASFQDYECILTY